MAQHFRRWALADVWRALFEAVQEPVYAWVLVGLTAIKAHKAAAGQKKHRNCRSHRPLTRRLDDQGPCLGQRPAPSTYARTKADSPQLAALLAALPTAPGAVGADKAYGTNAVLAAVARADAEPVIPPKTSRKQPQAYNTSLHADRNKVECFFGRLKEARGFAPRYEKTATSFPVVAHLLAALGWIG